MTILQILGFLAVVFLVFNFILWCKMYRMMRNIEKNSEKFLTSFDITPYNPGIIDTEDKDDPENEGETVSVFESNVLGHTV